MFILNGNFKEYAFYIYTNFDPVKNKIVKRPILFLPGLTISSDLKNLKQNMNIIAVTLENSARRTFKNDKIRFDYKITAAADNDDINDLILDLMGMDNSDNKVH